VKRLLRPLPLVVVIGTIALVSLLAYGLASGGSKRTIDDAVARGERPAAPKLDLPPLKGAPAGKHLADYKGKVVVLNVWGSWCPPCRAEAPVLAEAARDLGGKGVAFLGINSRNPERAGPRAFEERYKVPYDSIYDPGGRTLLAFHGTLPPNSIPSTVIIDSRGRVAASVVGQVTRNTLDDLVDEVRSS
jgi:thiol-disulfide isomerase/thioredoxin